MVDGDGSIDEKRVYADRDDTTTAFVASGAGVVRVEVSDDIVGEFSLERRGTAVDLAADGRRLAVATSEDVLYSDGGGFEETGFGPAAAVGFHDGLVAAGDGRVARREDGGWSTLAELPAVRAVDGDLVAAASGVHRLDGTHVGLEAARDVATAGGPLAATDDGLYSLANGWMVALDGAFEVAAGHGDGRAHAATAGTAGTAGTVEISGAAATPETAETAGTLYARDDVGGEEAGGDSAGDGDAAGDAAGDGWTAVDLPVDGTVADVAYADATFVVTRDGTLLVDAGDGWRYRSLGLPEVSAVVVVH